MSIINNWSQLKIIEYQNKIVTDEINTNDGMRPERSEQAKQLHMTDKKTININI
jgi:hypothetical protein